MGTHGQTVLVAEAILERGRYSWIWVVASCPYCGRQHAHYGGGLEHDPCWALRHPLPASCTRGDQPRRTLGVPATRRQYLLQPDHRSMPRLREQDPPRQRSTTRPGTLPNGR